MYMGPYTISKHAAVALSEVLYHEIQASKWDVGVSVLCPTVTATRIADFDTKGYPASLQGMASTGPSEAEQRHASRTRAIIAAGRDPAEVAEVVHQGVLEGRFYLFVDDSFDAMIQQRQAAINARTNPPSR
jgi:NAD(P)-dependent dehydrogenase (short-subunit alcohol dehydrogenase family)